MRACEPRKNGQSTEHDRDRRQGSTEGWEPTAAARNGISPAATDILVGRWVDELLPGPLLV
jgi:hypothetical protein